MVIGHHSYFMAFINGKYFILGFRFLIQNSRVNIESILIIEIVVGIYSPLLYHY